VIRPTPPSLLAIALTLVGGLAVGYGLFTDGLVHRQLWVIVLALVSIVAWVLRGVAGRLGLQRLDLALCILAAFAGGLVGAPTNGISVIAAAISVMVIVGQLGRPLFVGLSVALVTIALVAIGAVPFGTPVLSVLAMIGGVVLGVVGGISRRQYRLAEEQLRVLGERELAVREERSRVALLGQRQEVARDIHDVLAHSLGGLVIQLDAVEALLEAGDVQAAQRRVTDARRLAAAGLGEARRAVEALRDPEASTTVRGGEHLVGPDELARTVDDLVEAHRSLGGAVDLSVSGDAHPIGPAEAAALQRALQEALSNARKHAPGQAVGVELDWTRDDRVSLTVSNPLGPEHPGNAHRVQRMLAETGGGHGLEGMRERFTALPLGGSVDARRQADSFVVTATAMVGGAGTGTLSEGERS
jgi:signal transduction histidine kinase